MANADLPRMGEMGMLSGMMYCADCGAKMYQVRANGWTHDKEHFVCATYHKVKGGCSSHQIRNVVVEQLVAEDLRKCTGFRQRTGSGIHPNRHQQFRKELAKEKVNGRRMQRIRITSNCIDEINIPEEPEEDEKSA